MGDERSTITLKAIGIVHNEVKDGSPHGPDLWRELVSEIVIDSSLTEALDGLEEYSHITVLWWMHQLAATAEFVTKRYPHNNQELPLVGVFAWRSPIRPNPIGKTTVRLLQRQGNILTVKGLDALDGSPVIDIKPYVPRWDSAPDARMPWWATNQ